MQKESEQMEKRAIKAERQRDAALDKVTQQRQKSYELETALEEEKGKNLKLRAQINRDYENSSIPSSKTIRHKKMSNGRKKTAVSRVPCRDIQGTAGKADSHHGTDSATVAPGSAGRSGFQKDLKDVYYNSKTGERFMRSIPPALWTR